MWVGVRVWVYEFGGVCVWVCLWVGVGLGLGVISWVCGGVHLQMLV